MIDPLFQRVVSNFNGPGKPGAVQELLRSP